MALCRLRRLKLLPALLEVRPELRVHLVQRGERPRVVRLLSQCRKRVALVELVDDRRADLIPTREIARNINGSVAVEDAPIQRHLGLPLDRPRSLVFGLKARDLVLDRLDALGISGLAPRRLELRL
jgi:hypothetical protein